MNNVQMEKKAEQSTILYFDLHIPLILKNSPKPFGGISVEWLSWMKAFSNIGCKCKLLTYFGTPKLEKYNYFEILDIIDENKKFIFQLYPIYKLLKKENPTFIVQEGANRYTGIFAFLSKLLKKPFIHRIASDMDVDDRIVKHFSKIYLYFYRYGIKNASHLSCQNKYQFKILKKKFPQKSISILYNPFEFKEILDTKIAKDYIAWIGNFRFEKNLPALAKIAKELPEIKFKVAGSKFKITDEDTEIGLLELENLRNVEFVGHIKNSEITQFLSKAFCLLNTSRLEGFSNTFLESWSVGVPVITTTNVNPDNLISQYKLGIVADNYDQIPNIINKFITEEEYIDFRERCINYVKANHDPIKLAEKFLQEIKNCVKKI